MARYPASMAHALAELSVTSLANMVMDALRSLQRGRPNGVELAGLVGEFQTWCDDLRAELDRAWLE
jgi:hypothetical protein